MIFVCVCDKAGAIYAGNGSMLTFDGYTSFLNNSAKASGGENGNGNRS